MGMHVHVRAVQAAVFQRLEQAEVYAGLERGQTPSVHLEKAWHGLHFLLTGSAGKSGMPLGFLLEGGQEVGEDDGYGAPRRRVMMYRGRIIHDFSGAQKRAYASMACWVALPKVLAMLFHKQLDSSHRQPGDEEPAQQTVHVPTTSLPR